MSRLDELIQEYCPYGVIYLSIADAAAQFTDGMHNLPKSSSDDIVFEVELIKQIEINIDYILMLVKKYHDTHCEDKEVLITIQKAIDAVLNCAVKNVLLKPLSQASMVSRM